MAAPVAAAAVAGAGRAAAAGGTRAAVGSRAAASRAAARTRAGSARHAAAGQTGRDARQLADLGMGYVAGKRSKPRAKTRPRRGPSRALIAEFTLCTILLALSPLAQEPGKTAPKDWMKRGTAICAVFALLGLLSAVGPRAGRTAAALGGLITLALAIDQRSVLGVLADRLKTTGTAEPDPTGPPTDDDPGDPIRDPAPRPNLPPRSTRPRRRA